MNEHDHAVLVGISRYADAASEHGWIGNLHGPDNDARAIAEWLEKPTGGGLPGGNVTVICSADAPDPFPPGGAAPQQQLVEGALNGLAHLPRTAYEGQYAGRRLYIYVSGHGLATKPEEAAIVTAEAEFGRPLNVTVTSWIEWVNTAGLFQELVLWVDCCATRVFAFLKPCDRNQEVGPNAGTARRFIAYAAPFNKKAVENQMADGLWHGAFTYALLRGLEGATAGPVTSTSLRDYLRNNMSSFMNDDQRKAKAVATEPAFGPTDEMTFGSPLAVSPRTEVTLRFPAKCVGMRATVSVDASSPLTAETVLQAPDWKLQLEAGAYVAFVPDTNQIHPFIVNGDEQDAVIAIS
jgi:hypothetical protein